MKFSFFWQVLTASFCAFMTASAQVDVTDSLEAMVEEATNLGSLEFAGDMAIALVYPNKSRDDVGAFFAYRDTGSFKIIFWNSTKSPMIYTTVTLDTYLNPSTAIIDTTPRSFSFPEAILKKIYTDAILAVRKDTTGNYTDQNVYFVCLPYMSDHVWKVYLYLRALPPARPFCGTERVYHFDSELKIAQVDNPHRYIKDLGYTLAADTTAGGMACHTHENENSAHFSIFDIETAIYYCRGPLPVFIMKEGDNVYSFDLRAHSITRWERNRFLKEYVAKYPRLTSHISNND